MKFKYLKPIYIVLLLSFTLYLLLDTFVIERSYNKNIDMGNSTTSNLKTGKIESNNSYYKDDNIEITFKEERVHDTSVYIADVKVLDMNFLKTAFANNTYGRNIKQKTSDMAKDHNAILAINGDYYGVKEDGYVLKNGVLYRSDVRSKEQEDLVIYKDGTYGTIIEGETKAENLINQDVYNLLAFGPVLVRDSKVVVSEEDEVPTYNVSNPRTAIGFISENHFIFVVSDGRTSNSVGLTLYELGEYMKSLGVTFGYNLDGGGSSTMYFNGKVKNNPTDGHNDSERRVSDIIYVGY